MVTYNLLDDPAALLTFIWITCACCSVIVYLYPLELGCIARHGKLLSVERKELDDSLTSNIVNIVNSSSFKVPKSLFWHFYLIGIMMTLSIMVVISELRITLILFLVHCGRRLYECVYITCYSESQMHLFGYCCGVMHYILTPLTLAGVRNDSVSSVSFVCAVLLFAIGNIEQYRVHATLYREKLLKLKRRRLPLGYWFNFVCCPHYTAEILIYFCFVLLNTSDIALLAMFLWVSSNLAVVSDFQYKWYQTYAVENLVASKAGWKIRRILPFCW
jgi:3-oxo-5-alpha-steroid 4-dehydrogenase